ncbi:conserved hypothetical protein [delta proteobacterium NaphS2]|nr:conserved hypothetical protein [delta proteobacterium NaphS2]
MKTRLREFFRQEYGNGPKNATYLNCIIYQKYMLTSLLFPFDAIQPSELLSRYSDWIYFFVVFAFFVSIAGITLRKHFSKAYLKPLIFSVAMFFTIGVFKYRQSLKAIFEGWGILGAILLVFITATIPYGLCRGFGMTGKKAFYLTYVLFYILSWVKFPEIYYELAERNLGLVNLALLVLCIFSVYKMIKSVKSPKRMAEDLNRANPFKPDIEHELSVQNKEKQMLKRRAGKITAGELHSLDGIASELAEIQRIVEWRKNSLGADERQRISQILRAISKNEALFKGAALELARSFKGIEIMDTSELDELKKRLERVSGKEKHVLQKVINREKEKIRIERAVVDFNAKTDQYLNSLNASLGAASAKMETGYPYDALSHIVRARIIVKDLKEMIKEVDAVENRLLQLINLERKLLKKERRIS